MNEKCIDKTGRMRRLICAINVSTWYEHIKILDLVCINARLANIAQRAAKILIRNKTKIRIFIGKFSFFDGKLLSIYLKSHVFVMLVKFVVGRINGIFDSVEIERRKFRH